MTDPKPHFRSAGEGPVIICLHSSVSSSKQWQTLTDHLCCDYQVIAPDLYGYGKSPDWTKKRPFTLNDEVDLLHPIIDSLSGSFHLVGHSYGAAVAFKLALTDPTLVRSLTAYEPVLFNLLFDLDPDHAAAKEVWKVSDDIRTLVADGNSDQAAERFINYWSGEDSWQSLPDWQQRAILDRMSKVVSDFEATIGNKTELEQYTSLDIPTLFLYGMNSPRSTRLIAETIGGALPNAEFRGLLGLGHMGPVTHADQLCRIISRFIKHQPHGILVHQLRQTETRPNS